MSFDEKLFTWKFYITNKILPIIKQVQIVDLKEFIIAALDVNNKIFMIHVAIHEQEEMPMHFKK